VHGLALRRIKVEQTHNALLLQDIDSCDAVILDCRHASVPAWIAACLLTRPVPTIKLVHLAEGEAITKVALHPLIAGTKMDAREPVPEHLLFWRFQEDLEDQLVDILGRINDHSPSLLEPGGGLTYFKSIGRRKAKFFISNSGTQRKFATTFVNELSENNLDYFHYKVDIEGGELWKKRLRQELMDCDGLIAFIDNAYLKSEWSKTELNAALARSRKEPDKFFFSAYNIGDARVEEISNEHNAKDLNPEDVEARIAIIERIDTWLKKEGAQERKRRRSLIPGGTRELLLEVIRQLPEVTLQNLGAELGLTNADLEMVEPTDHDLQQPHLSRRSAKNIVEALHQDDTPFAADRANEHPLVKFCGRIREIYRDERREPVDVLTARLREINLDE
jgi:TIR domain